MEELRKKKGLSQKAVAEAVGITWDVIFGHRAPPSSLPAVSVQAGQTARECEGEKAVKLPERMKMLRLREGLRQEDAAKELDISMSALCENVGISYTPHPTTTIRSLYDLIMTTKRS